MGYRLIKFKLNPATIIICLFVCEHIVCLFVYNFYNNVQLFHRSAEGRAGGIHILGKVTIVTIFTI